MPSTAFFHLSSNSTPMSLINYVHEFVLSVLVAFLIQFFPNLENLRGSSNTPIQCARFDQSS